VGLIIGTEAKMSEHTEWLETFKASYDQHQGKGGFQVLFPEYRPDMTRALAHDLGLEFYDYRLKKMISLGWEAGNISLESLTQTLQEESTHVGLVVHNVEALLAVKSEDERKQWLNEFLTFDWSNPIVLPLAIYQAETDPDNPRVCDLKITEFPKESFLMRLAM